MTEYRAYSVKLAEGLYAEIAKLEQKAGIFQAKCTDMESYVQELEATIERLGRKVSSETLSCTIRDGVIDELQAKLEEKEYVITTSRVIVNEQSKTIERLEGALREITKWGSEDWVGTDDRVVEVAREALDKEQT